MTLADAIEAHDEALQYGGRAGISDLGLIESAVTRPYSGYFRPIHKKAAALLQSVSGNHGFIDGNKRTAWLLVELLIIRCGYELAIPDDEPIDNFVVAVVTHDLSFEDAADWFQVRVVRPNEK